MYELIYDYCSEDGQTEEGIRDIFNGSWDNLQDCIKSMRKQGFYNISAAFIGPEDNEEGEEE